MAILKKHTRSLVLGGLFLLIPLLFIVIALDKLIQLWGPLGAWLPKVAGLHSIFGKTSVLIVCFILILLICYISGLLIQKGFVRKWSDSEEERLIAIFPSLQIFKLRLLKDKKDAIHDFWPAILLKDNDGYSIAFITETT
jgi:hypothetical protein